MDFDQREKKVSFDFSTLTYRKPASGSVVHVPNKPAAKPELPPDVVLELWEERSAIQQTDNLDLLLWHRSRKSPAWLARRHCELNAAADLALQYGDYVLAVIEPHIITAMDAATMSKGGG